MNLIPGEVKTYTSVSRLVSENDNEILQFRVEFLDSLEMTGSPPHTLTIVMLLRNMNVALGLLNGTRVIVRNMYTNALMMEKTNVAVASFKRGSRSLSLIHISEPTRPY